MFCAFRRIPPLLLLASLAHSDVARLQPVVAGARVGGGCRIDYVRPTSPAQQAGFQIGDFIVGVDSRPVQSFENLKDAISRAGAQTRMEFLRAGQTRQTTAELLPPGGKESRLGISCSEAESTPYRVILGSFTVTAQASLVRDLTLVRVNVVNNSDRPVEIGPKILSAADSNRLMLKELSSADVASILQADLDASEAEQAAARSAHTQSSSNPLAFSLGSYIFGTVGLKGSNRDLAAGLVEGAVLALSQDSPASITPPAITPGVVAREALETSNLDPGYSAEGIVFFTVPKNLPFTLLITINGEKSSIGFDSAVSDDALKTLNEEAPAETNRAEIPCPYSMQTGTRVHLVLKDGRSFNGKLEKCGGEIGLRTGILYRTFDAARVSSLTKQ